MLSIITNAMFQFGTPVWLVGPSRSLR